MAVVTTLLFTFSLMFLAALARPELMGNNGDSLGTFEVGQSGKELYILENNNIVLPCGIKISTSQVLVHGWRKGKNRIPRQLINYSTLDLELENVSPADEGEYRCFVQTGFGTILGPIHTILNPLLSTLEAVVVVVQGVINTSVVLPCPIQSVPTGEVRWVTSENITLDSTRYKQLMSGGLLILSLRPQDAGEFHCKVVNRVLNQEMESSVQLRVNVTPTDFGPVILDTFPDTVVLSAETKQFYCVGIGRPQPTNTWIVSYTLQEDSFLTHPQTAHTSLGNILWLNKENGSSRYDCVASIGAGSEQISKSIDTHAPPSFPNLPTLKYPAAKTVRFECKSTSTPLIWYKNGELLETNTGRVKTRNNELVISNTVSGDAGIYQCESSKFLGTGRLIIESSLERLSPPADVSCSATSPRSLLIRWKVRSEADNIHAFSIHYTPTAGGVETQKVTNNTSHLLEPLLPNTNYSIYVRAYSMKSASPQSKLIFCSTMDDSPQRKPSSLQFHVVGNNSVRVSWDMPTVTTLNVISYHVEVNNSLHQKNESSVIATNNTSVTLENLAENTNYFVRVLAELSGGGPPGEYSSTIVFRISNNQNQSLNVNTSTTIPAGDGGEGGQNPSGTENSSLLDSDRNLGLILGTTLGLVSIILCGTIILCRNRCFSFLSRRGRGSRRGSYMPTGTSGKDTVDSAPLEMKVLTTHLDLDVQPSHLDTKGGHPNGGIFDGVCDPLVGGHRDRLRVEDEGDMSSS